MKHVTLADSIPVVGPRSATLVALSVGGIPPADPAAEAVIVDLLVEAMAAYDGQAQNGGTGVGSSFATIAAMPADYAAHGFSLLLLSRFPDGAGDTADLDDAAVLCLVALLSAAGRGQDALDMLLEETARRRTGAFLTASFAARCAVLGQEPRIATLWPAATPRWLTRDQAEAAIHARPLSIESHREQARRLAEAGRMADAVAAFATALALPLGASDKRGVAADLAVLAVLLATTGEGALLAERRLRLALAADPALGGHALATLEGAPPICALADPAALAAVIDLFGEFTTAEPALVSPFPLRGGKPHINMTFLEITNYCNQKCTFCPDMHREDARTWLPLDQVKRIIDELAENVSMNMMQLNAYGEPLLHPNIDEILAYIRAKKLPWPTFFTTHGLTLVDKKLKQLSHNYPTGIAVSLHNDNQESYAATRSTKIGDYATMATRVGNLLRQMAHEGADCHLRLYQMVNNGHEDPRVPPAVRDAFPSDPRRTVAHVRQWEGLAAEIAASAPPEVRARALFNTTAEIEHAFRNAVDDGGIPLPILEWQDAHGHRQHAFMSCRPLETYANLLLEYDGNWTVERRLLNAEDCRFIRDPSLTIFATGQLGLCCLDLNGTANFGNLADFPSLMDAMNSPGARAMFAQLSNGIAVSPGCQICLSTGLKQCGDGSGGGEG